MLVQTEGFIPISLWAQHAFVMSSTYAKIDSQQIQIQIQIQQQKW